MRIRRKNDPTNEIAIMTNIDQDKKNRNFRLVIDSGSTITIIPYFIRERMKNDSGWDTVPSKSIIGYGAKVKIYKVSTLWEVSLGDGVSWTDWIELKELFSWQRKVPKDIDCGLVGFDVLDNTYQIKVPGQPYIFVTKNNIINQLQQMYNGN